MDDLIFKHEAELLSQHSLSLSGSIAGDSSVPFVQYLVTEQVRGGEIDVRGTGYKIVNSGGNDELRIQKPMGTPEDRKARDLSSPALYILPYISLPLPSVLLFPLPAVETTSRLTSLYRHYRVLFGNLTLA